MDTHNEVLLSYKKECDIAICSNMAGCRENIILSEASEIERQVLCDNINMKRI